MLNISPLTDSLLYAQHECIVGRLDIRIFHLNTVQLQHYLGTSYKYCIVQLIVAGLK